VASRSPSTTSRRECNRGTGAEQRGAQSGLGHRRLRQAGANAGERVHEVAYEVAQDVVTCAPLGWGSFGWIYPVTEAIRRRRRTRAEARGTSR
jgi:hypothetical protein